MLAIERQNVNLFKRSSLAPREQNVYVTDITAWIVFESSTAAWDEDLEPSFISEKTWI